MTCLKCHKPAGNSRRLERDIHFGDDARDRDSYSGTLIGSPVSRQTAREWHTCTPGGSCRYCPPGPRLPSQPQSVSALCRVGSHFPYQWRRGQTELSWVAGYIPRRITRHEDGYPWPIHILTGPDVEQRAITTTPHRHFVKLHVDYCQFHYFTFTYFRLSTSKLLTFGG